MKDSAKVLLEGATHLLIENQKHVYNYANDSLKQLIKETKYIWSSFQI